MERARPRCCTWPSACLHRPPAPSTVLGRPPAADPAQLARVGFVAQDTPTYARLTIADHLRFGRQMNPGWDDALARQRIADLDLDLDQTAGSLSGGQRAQLALTLAVAKRPELLILDEPVASLDPLARREFLQRLMEFVAEGDVSVVLSSHLVADLERVCDYLIVLVDSRLQVAGEVDDLLASHHRLVGPRRDPESLPSGQEVIEESHTDRQSTLHRAMRRTGARSRLDGGGPRPRGPRSGLHGQRQHRSVGHARGWRCSRDRFLVAPVPHAGGHRRSRAGRSRRHPAHHRSPSGVRSTTPRWHSAGPAVAPAATATTPSSAPTRSCRSWPPPWCSSCPCSSACSGVHRSSPVSSRRERSAWPGPRA